MFDYQMHRWKYDPLLMLHTCVPPSIGDVPNPQRCGGCGIKVTDEALCRFLGGNIRAPIISASLNFLAANQEAAG